MEMHLLWSLVFFVLLFMKCIEPYTIPFQFSWVILLPVLVYWATGDHFGEAIQQDDLAGSRFSLR
jgi:hypothetical protein